MTRASAPAAGRHQGASDATILFATTNRGKLGEASAALAELSIAVCTLDELDLRGEVEESGATFAENARLKACFWSEHWPGLTLADDSGLEVDALGGAPGVRSARYGGSGLDDAGRNRRLLEALRGVPGERRGARFRCALALARGGRVVCEVEASREGSILAAERGTDGFGYDPLFFVPELGLTFAELEPAVKRAESHRGRALALLARALSGSLSPACGSDL